MKNILKSSEIAKYCGVSLETVINWIQRDHLKGCHIPGQMEYLVQIDQFLNFLKTSRLVLAREFHSQSHRVLIVDDDVGMAQSIKRTLGIAGFATMVCNDGFHAGVELGNFNPTVLTLDIRMPMVSGFEIVKFVRTTAFLKHTKILMISGMPQQELDVAIKVGADEVLAKPFQNETLAKVAMSLSVESILEAQEKGAHRHVFPEAHELEAQTLHAF
jgi:PleD family two-component response regulator